MGKYGENQGKGCFWLIIEGRYFSCSFFSFFRPIFYQLFFIFFEYHMDEPTFPFFNTQPILQSQFSFLLSFSAILNPTPNLLQINKNQTDCLQSQQMQSQKDREFKASWCAENFWLVGIVLGLIGLGVAAAFLLGFIGGSGAQDSNAKSLTTQAVVGGKVGSVVPTSANGGANAASESGNIVGGTASGENGSVKGKTAVSPTAANNAPAASTQTTVKTSSPAPSTNTATSSNASPTSSNPAPKNTAPSQIPSKSTAQQSTTQSHPPAPAPTPTKTSSAPVPSVPSIPEAQIDQTAPIAVKTSTAPTPASKPVEPVKTASSVSPTGVHPIVVAPILASTQPKETTPTTAVHPPVTPTNAVTKPTPIPVIQPTKTSSVPPHTAQPVTEKTTPHPTANTAQPVKTATIPPHPVEPVPQKVAPASVHPFAPAQPTKTQTVSVPPHVVSNTPASAQRPVPTPVAAHPPAPSTVSQPAKIQLPPISAHPTQATPAVASKPAPAPAHPSTPSTTTTPSSSTKPSETTLVTDQVESLVQSSLKNPVLTIVHQSTQNHHFTAPTPLLHTLLSQVKTQ